MLSIKIDLKNNSNVPYFFYFNSSSIQNVLILLLINALFLLRCTQIISPTTISAIGDNNINPLFSYPIEYSPVFSIGSPKTCIPNKVPEPKIL
jgi:hypothetical protein